MEDDWHRHLLQDVHYLVHSDSMGFTKKRVVCVWREREREREIERGRERERERF